MVQILGVWVQYGVDIRGSVYGGCAVYIGGCGYSVVWCGLDIVGLGTV